MTSGKHFKNLVYGVNTCGPLVGEFRGRNNDTCKNHVCVDGERRDCR